MYTHWEIFTPDVNGFPEFRDTTIADEKSDALKWAQERFGPTAFVEGGIPCHWCDAVIEFSNGAWYDRNGGGNCLWVDKRTGDLNRLIDANGRWLIHEPHETVWERENDSED